ncbi:MAG: hypothetical protein JJ992_22415 [Planctomycetes bacterium]|nr:hypothetical protein [Planctomycetota bacterium]
MPNDRGVPTLPGGDGLLAALGGNIDWTFPERLAGVGYGPGAGECPAPRAAGLVGTVSGLAEFPEGGWGPSGTGRKGLG